LKTAARIIDIEVKMLKKIKDTWKSITGQKCLACGKLNDENSFKEYAQIPGWLDEKEKYFCSSACLESWKSYAKERGKVKSCCCCGIK
jgi:hypothetical protein